ncbi:MAG: PHP domain-containing protein [Elusimicrobia bacterium]|nr:PHP domain-containing protein [Elusimicrobiota bacterium]
MTTRFVDLHVHTNFSDGTFTPEEAVRYAHKTGLSAISITDHDTIYGIADAIEEGKKCGVEIVPGIELSCTVNTKQSSEMHILGYFINWTNGAFQETLTVFQKARLDRAHKIIKRLAEIGVPLDVDTVQKIAGRGTIGRLHIAKALVEDGSVTTSHEAFTKYLGNDKPAFVPKMHLSPEDAIKMIQRVGGIAVLAHPHYGQYSNRNLLKALVAAGLRGIEVLHSKHPPATVDLFVQLSREFGLIATGGSDCHGPYADNAAIMGSVKIPYSVLEELKTCKEKIDRENATIFASI